MLSRKTLTTLQPLVLFVGCFGCSTGEDTLSEAWEKAQRIQRGETLGTAESASETESDDRLKGLLDEEGPAEQLTRAVPYPNRVDPFEFGEGEDEGTPQASQETGVELKLYGFVGEDNPKAIIHSAGKTRMLQAGDKWGAIEVVDVTPPSVRIKSDGVLRVWSLLGRQNAGQIQ